ncbi:MAG: hypothetical protein CL878_15850, partial [Dehalococcoidia bacterium]|nr:hypothetical protein [Dehalococcoidia bacterium]
MYGPMTLWQWVLAAVGAVIALALFAAAVTLSRTPSEVAPTATIARATAVLAATPSPVPNATPAPTREAVARPEPTAVPTALAGRADATSIAVATAGVSSAVTLPEGWFFALPEGTANQGFAVLDEPDGPPFATAYRLNGGFAVLGRPVSRSLQLSDGAIYQLFANGLLRWQPGTPAVAVTRVDLLAFATLDGLEDQLWWLGVPRRAPPWDDRLAPTPDPRVRLQWLTEPTIAVHYLGPSPASGQESAGAEPPQLPPGLRIYGWPESRPEHVGAYIAQRFQRAVLRVQLTPGAGSPPAGTVEVLPLGPLIAHTSVFQGPATAPDTLVDERIAARAPRPVLEWPVLPAPTPTSALPTVAPTAVALGLPTVGPVSTPAVGVVVPDAALRLVAVVNEGSSEHVVVANGGSQPQNLRGWVLESQTGGQRYAFPAVTLAPGMTVRVHSGQGSAAAAVSPT